MAKAVQEFSLGEVWARMKAYINSRLRAFNFNGVVRETLLWENPDPTASFAAQTISLDLSEYEYVRIEICHGGWAGAVCEVTIKIGDTGLAQWGLVDSVVRSFSRYIQVKTNSIVFETGYSANGTSASTDNARTIPWRIYGIKAKPTAEITDDSIIIQNAQAGRDFMELNGAVTETLLWTNASPSSSFAAQTISLDLSDYDGVRVVHMSNGYNAYYSSSEVPKDLPISLTGTTGTGGGEYTVVRNGAISSSGISFGLAYCVGTGYSYDTRCTPVRIYGIKTLS